ncbi:MAG: D-2-hydroxyacid dehydrogenase family protein [Proteobacteria bacterium]|nr:D-2-hydroxyacid dehydrogenase family protein [Pseudomonadota bacterium]
MKIAILDDYQDACRTLDAWTKLAGHDVTVFRDTLKDEDALVARLKDFEALALIRERTRFTASLLERLPKLRALSQTGKAGAHIDLAACNKLGIAVLEGSGSPYATSELTWGLVLAAMRRIPHEVENLKKGGWQQSVGRALRGRTLGIYGFGKIGSVVAGYGRAFGMKVQVWGREGSLERAKAAGFEAAASREALFATSDVLTIHIRLAPETQGMVTGRDLALMKPDAVFVNTSRAELVAPGALAAGLVAGRPGFAAVDVYEEEPVQGAAHPLLALANAICTPHLGYVEKDGYELYFGSAFDNLAAFAKTLPQGKTGGA